MELAGGRHSIARGRRATIKILLLRAVLGRRGPPLALRSGHPHTSGTGTHQDELSHSAVPRVRGVQGSRCGVPRGDIAALRAAVDDPGSIPNGSPHPAIFDGCLVHAIYHSPLSFIGTLLQLGADPRPSDYIGFPPLIAASSRSRPVPGAPARADVTAVIELLLEFQADPNQRGINDYTALHMAVSEGNTDAIQLLLDAGAEPTLRIRIDDCDTPLEMARRADRAEIVNLLSSSGTQAGRSEVMSYRSTRPMSSKAPSSQRRPDGSPAISHRPV